jgi:hypothetical protein
MTCRECERILVDTGHSLGRSQTASYLAQAHVENCSACKSKFNGIAEVDAALALWAESTKSCEAAVEIERHLLVLFRERNRKVSSREAQRNWHFARWAIAALVLIASFLGYAVMRPKSAGTTAVNLRTVGAGAPRSLSIQHSAAKSLPPRRVVRKRPHIGHQRTAVAVNLYNNHRENTDVRAPVQRERIQEDVAVSSGKPESETDGGTVVRVTLPASSLGMIGWSVPPDTSDRRVTADIVLDPYGVVQRVNLVGPLPIRK